MADSYYTVLFCALLFALILFRERSRRKLPLPPSPPALPILGHVFSFPPEYPEIGFYELGKKYGDIMHLRTPGQTFIVLNNAQIAVDLLDKRGHNYSDRPAFPVFELMGWSPALTFLRYGPQFRLHRKLLQDFLSKRRCEDYRSIQTREARKLLRNLITEPERYNFFFSMFSASVIVQIAFGHEVRSEKDPYLQIAEEACHSISESTSAGTSAVDLFPFLRYFPSWFPGTTYANLARQYRPAVRKFHEFPAEQVIQKLAEGVADSSFLASKLADLDDDAMRRLFHDIQGAAGVMYVGGAETTLATLGIFVFAMVMNPGCLKRAQAEIDACVGTDRLPDFDDRDSLPYIDCIVHEVLRWYPIVPSGVPHRTLADDVYNGMLIPKDSLIIPNTRGMSWDERVYKDPFKFRPERYLAKPLGDGEPLPVGPFGFGRRICPGRHLASGSLYITFASMLASLSISKAQDKDGNEITPELKLSPGLTRHIRPFPCNIKPRSEMHAKLIGKAGLAEV